MLLVIFGAGASFDSDPRYAVGTDPNSLDSPAERNALDRANATRPPLTENLFADRFRPFVDRYPRCAPLITRLRRDTASGTALEQALETLREEGKNNMRIAAELTSLRYYLRDVTGEGLESWREHTHGMTNYVDLLASVDNWQRPERKS
jgi:hypothetical protein